MQTVLVNATALVSGGALSILKQFIENLDKNIYHIFVSEGVDLDSYSFDSSKVKIWHLPQKNFLKRIYWDFFGLKKFAKLHDLRYQTIISLQNTSIASEAENQIVYIHQGIPFCDRDWSFFRRSERSYAIYKYIYPWFIFANSNKYTKFVVQTEWMRTALIDKFNVCEDNVFNLKPDFIRWPLKGASSNSDPFFYIFYPATGEVFKNHELIFRALNYLFLNNVSIENVRVYFTFFSNQYPHIDKLVKQYPHLERNIIFTGKLTYKQVTELYENVDLIVFPSQIESFGLPLLESAYAGRQIIALATPFAHEILEDYKGCCFLQDDCEEWGRAIADIITKPRQVYSSFSPNFENGWNDFFKLIK